jgi:hypothetical protein
VEVFTVSPSEREKINADDLLIIDLGDGLSALIAAHREGDTVTVRIGERTTTENDPGVTVPSQAPRVPMAGADVPRNDNRITDYRIAGDAITIPASSLERLGEALLFVHRRHAG